MIKRITAPISRNIVKELRAGEQVLLSGTIFAARDAAHQRMAEALREGKELPIPIDGTTIYYMGPSPARAGRAIGSAGPTTSGRMDKYTPALLELGMIGMIGKGERSAEVIESMKAHGAVYFAATGGAGALLSGAIVEAEVTAYGDLGTEAIHKLKIKDFPVIVVIDSEGNNLYKKNYSEI